VKVKRGKILLLSGWREAGKTTLCERIVAAARRAGWDAAGVISPPDLSRAGKTGIQVRDLRTGEQRLLARRSRPGEETRSSLTPEWMFDAESLTWGNAVLRGAVPCDLLVVDELGPLELLSGQGWQAGIAAVDSGDYRLALVVARPELVEAASRRWPRLAVIVLGSPEHVTVVAERITRRFFSQSQVKNP